MTAKLLFVAFLILLLCVPLNMVSSVINDRRAIHHWAEQDIVAAWGGQQIIGGPVLTLPYAEEWRTIQGVINRTEALAHFLPAELDIIGEIKSEIRYRGLHEVPVYIAVLNLSGYFEPPDLGALGVTEAQVDWAGASVSIGVSDPSTISESVNFKWQEQSVAFEPRWTNGC